jgi:hypothetical protein
MHGMQAWWGDSNLTDDNGSLLLCMRRHCEVVLDVKLCSTKTGRTGDISYFHMLFAAVLNYNAEITPAHATR